MFRWPSSLKLTTRLAAALVVVGVLAAVESAGPSTVEGATFTVNTTSDTTDGTCNATHCSLREAITVANSTGGPDTIAFNISGGGAQVINVSTTLPDITGPLTIDGATQPGYAGAPLIQLNGAVGLVGLPIEAPTTVVGLAITRFATGVYVYSAGTGSVIRSSWIGIDTSGAAAANASIGLLVGANDVVVGGTSIADRNVISGNHLRNVLVSNADNLAIVGNYIGTNPAGTAGYSLQNSGIDLGDGSGTIGGTTPGARNIISGHVTYGIRVGAPGWTIEGNYVGLSADGTTAIPNEGGIYARSTTTVEIGGDTAASRNIISGNSESGIDVDDTSAPTIKNNYIGVQPDGVTPLGNGSGVSNHAGIRVFLSAQPSITGNVIAYSAGEGIIVTGTSAAAGIHSNYIFMNDQLGIDLGNNGVTPNDAGDVDAGPNTLQNFPTITAASTSPTGTLVSLDMMIGGSGGPAVVNVYRSDSCDPSGHGEGEEPAGITIGNITPPTETITNWSIPGVTPGSFLTAQLAYEGSSEFGPCFTVPACPAPSADCDGFNDTTANNHTGPSNTTATVDNCGAEWNQNQLNTDGNFADQTPPHAIDDKTWPMSDRFGDACDDDRDNDGILDGVEGGLPYAPCPTASGPTNPLLFDTDGDRFHDGAECDLNTDPASAASKPGSSPAATAACGAAGDADGDKLLTRIEVCAYNTNPSVMDSDGDAGLDGARDGCEAASLNGDRTVNSGDQLLLSQEIGRVQGGGTPLASIDVNKDGNINSGDQLTMSFLIAPGGQCP